MDRLWREDGNTRTAQRSCVGVIRNARHSHSVWRWWLINTIRLWLKILFLLWRWAHGLECTRTNGILNELPISTIQRATTRAGAMNTKWDSIERMPKYRISIALFVSNDCCASLIYVELFRIFYYAAAARLSVCAYSSRMHLNWARALLVFGSERQHSSCDCYLKMKMQNQQRAIGERTHTHNAVCSTKDSPTVNAIMSATNISVHLFIRFSGRKSAASVRDGKCECSGVNGDIKGNIWSLCSCSWITHLDLICSESWRTLLVFSRLQFWYCPKCQREYSTCRCLRCLREGQRQLDICYSHTHLLWAKSWK